MYSALFSSSKEALWRKNGWFSKRIPIEQIECGRCKLQFSEYFPILDDEEFEDDEREFCPFCNHELLSDPRLGWI